MKETYFVTGIGTDVGKTVISAILTEALQADYWKPVQAGDLDNSDSIKVQNLLSNQTSIVHPEGIKLTQPMSPHAAAEIDNVSIETSLLQVPNTQNKLIIEGAGGLMVPLNNEDLILDLIKNLGVQTILVSSNYLGSINHTLLTYEVLVKNNISIAGIIFNGPENKETESFILQYTKLPCLLRVKQEEEINKETILKYADLWKGIQ